MRLHLTLPLGYRFIALVLWILLASWASVGSEQRAPPFEALTVEQLAERIPGKTFWLVNVHVPYEGELPSTDAFIPFDKITEYLDRLPSDLDAPIVLYCRSGRMSEIAATALVKLGYRNVSNLAGGMLAWEQAGNQLLYR
ncbi:MAG: rhodanese-like domain-containing protein [Devosia sp.]|uniref:rhodanese-like domain-containing protein n=1 Tax=Devosia sp. TaxID=1871048 RepID=UPI001AC5A94B|nr:rhodanese-like domain-containing protein [Devosia sp.]MBN9307773.1 rhodanese-like domain-containing protein [Devosia sp.]MBN9317234.1 rhodanese-like domain-containing protein [Devosia sp.]